MKALLVAALAAFLSLAVAAPGHAQEVLFAEPGAMPGGTVTLVGDGTSGPLFLGAEPNGLVAQRVAGRVDGRAFTNIGTLDIGFDYLRPFWSSRDFTLVIPPGSAGDFPLLGDVGHVDQQFAFVPRFKYDYQLVDLDFSLSTTANFLNLSGRLQRQLGTTAGGAAQLTAQSQLTMVTAILPEFAKTYAYGDLVKLGRHFGSLDDAEVTLSIGSRYSSIDQNYISSLTQSTGAGSNVATRTSIQSFRGVGITGASVFVNPVSPSWNLFNSVRGSVLVGENKKDSSLNVTLAGKPGTADLINQARTVFIPVVEAELGAEWFIETVRRVRADNVVPELRVRVAGVGQFWGDVGPLSAGSPQGFRRSDLFLVGLSITAGVQW